MPGTDYIDLPPEQVELGQLMESRLEEAYRLLPQWLDEIDPVKKAELRSRLCNVEAEAM